MAVKKLVTQETIKKSNKQNLLNTFEDTEELMVSEMIEKTGLTPVTINSILKELQEEQWIFESHLAESSGGRKPWVYKFNKDRNYLMQLFITKESIILNIMNLRGEFLKEIEYMTKIRSNEAMEEGIKHVLETHVDSEIVPLLLSISIHVSGIINNEEHTLLYSAPLNVHNFNFMTVLEALDLGEIPLYLFKRVDLLLIGSLSRSERKVMRSAYIMFKDGIGLSVMDNGNISSLKRGGYELGHTLYPDDGTLVKLGDFFKEELMVARYNNQYDSANPVVNSKEIFERRKKGDQPATKFVENLVSIICVVSSNVVNTFAPDILYIGGDNVDIIKEFDGEKTIRETILEPFNNHLDVRMKIFEHSTMIHGISDYILSSRVFRTPFK